MSNVIELKQVVKKYKANGLEETVLEDLSFAFQEGLKTSILGSSGCGKTTLLNLIGGIDSEFEGEILFRGTQIKDFDKFRREHVSFIFQDLNLISHHTLRKNITLGLTNDVMNKDEIAVELLRKVGLIEHADKKPHQLSGGERQRVAIARALARNTDILLCDEPTGSLDEVTKLEIMDLIVEVFKDKTLIFITHDEDIANKYSDVVLGIEDKKLTIKTNKNGFKDIGVTEVVKGHKKTFKRRFEINLLSKKLSIFNATYLLIIIAAIFIFGIGVVQGVEREIDNYLYDKYKVDRLLIRTGRLSLDGFSKNIEDYNASHDTNIIGFMTGAYSTITLEEDNQSEVFLHMLQPSVKESIEKDIVYGHYPKANDEVLYSRGSAIKTIYQYHQIKTENEVELFDWVTNLSDEQLFNELIKIDVSYKVYCRYTQDSFYDNDLKVVGLIDDEQYYDTLENPEPFLSNLRRYHYNINTNLTVADGEQTKSVVVNGSIYMLEEELTELFSIIYVGENTIKLSNFFVYIEEEDLDLRNEVFDNYLLFKPLFFGRMHIIEERESYYKEIHGYKVAIIGGCIIISIFSLVSLYNGLKTSIVRNRKNIGIYKSLGYTSKDIKYMFLLEGFIIAGFVTILTMFVWGGINFIMNEHLVSALDPNRILEMTRILNLNVYLVIAVIVSVVLIILTLISRELRKINIISLLRY